MAFLGGRVSRLALSLATTLVASTAVGQTYQQPAAAPNYPQPASYPTAPARPQPQTGTVPQQPVTYAAAPPATMNTAATGATGAQGYRPPAATGVYGAQPTQPAAAQPTYGAPFRPAPASNAIRRASFDQPIDGQQPAAAAAPATQPAAQPAGQPAAQPVAANSAAQAGPGVPSATPPSTVPADVLAGQTANEHQLAPAIRWARDGFKNANSLKDYSCTLVKRERIGGELNEHEYAFVKVRHEPFSVYMYFLGPAKVKGREALFVQGQNDNKLLAHDNGVRHRLIGTVSLKPENTIAMTGNRYPITEMGIRRLLERLIVIGENDMKYGECTVQWIQGAKVDGRTCTCIQVVHPVPRRNFLFHLARIYVDDEMQLPIRYEAYDWPARAGEQPQLTEEYTFLKVKVNNGFTDADFSVDNPAYGFK